MLPRKYSFVSSLDFLHVAEPLGSGWTVGADVKLSSSNTIAKGLVTQHLRYSAGDSDAKAILSGSPFLFSDADYPLENSSPEDQMSLLNARLGVARNFCNVLWLVKDNSVNFDRGFLQYPHRSPGGTPRVSINTWAYRYSKADGTTVPTTFSKDELQVAISIYKSLYGWVDSRDVSPALTPGTAGTVGRLPRALYFLQGARAMNDFPHKVANYCTSFEALVSTSSTELAHQVSERVAVLIGRDSNEALDIYRNLKRAYGTRSKLVHGDQLSRDWTTYLRESNSCDIYLRRLLHLLLSQHDVLEDLDQPADKVNEFFLRRLLDGPQSGVDVC